MGLFDSIKNTANQSFGNAPSNGFRSREIVFSNLPDTFEQFTSMPQAALSTPFDTAAMAVLAFCFYPQNSELSLEMVNYLRGPRPLSPMDKSFIKDRFRDSDYVPRSYFNGAVPGNDYLPAEPYAIKVSENPYSYQEQGYAKLYLTSGGADSPRPIQLRQTKDGKWYLWEQFLLAEIRQPESSNPWA